MRDLAFLPEEDSAFIEKKTAEFRLSFQDRQQLEIIASDLRRWDEGTIAESWQDPANPDIKGKDRRKQAMNAVKKNWNLQPRFCIG